MNGTSVRIFRARQGETAWNVAGRWPGHSASRLTPRGVERAFKLAEGPSDEPGAAVDSRDLGRALDAATAESAG
jgi:alpha-ribazole phosphatase